MLNKTIKYELREIKIMQDLLHRKYRIAESQKDTLAMAKFQNQLDLIEQLIKIYGDK